jgi:hypothetical protein
MGFSRLLERKRMTNEFQVLILQMWYHLYCHCHRLLQFQPSFSKGSLNIVLHQRQSYKAVLDKIPVVASEGTKFLNITV